MRNTLLASLLTLAGLFGLGAANPANADDLRVFVSLGDVYYRGGNPYYRYGDMPLSVVYYDHHPRYYYHRRPAYYRPYNYGAYYYGHSGDYRHHGYARRHDRGHDYRHAGYRGHDDRHDRGHDRDRHHGEHDHRRH